MNKTLMLVICDFLLLSMLALARFDPPEEAPEATLDATASSTSSEAELISLLEESLKAEQTDRSNLSEDLSETKEDLEAKARALAAREAALEKTRKDLEQKSTEAEQLAQTKAELEAEKARLAAEKADIEQQRTELSQKFEQTREQLESANTERVELAKDIGSIKEESTVAKERLSATEEKLLARELALAEREAELNAAKEEAQRLAKEREALNRELEVAKAERSLLQQNLNEEQSEKAALQAEKEAAFARAERLGENVSELGENVSQLGQNVTNLGQEVSSIDQNVSSVAQNVSSVAENVSTVAETSEAIQQEIFEARPQTMSEIFTRFQNNRALIEFKSREKAMLSGVSEKTYTSKSILLKDETGTHYLVTHHSDTPFNLAKNNTVLSVDLQVTLGKRSYAINQVGFLATDPRILFIPLPKQYVAASGLETFELAIQPERWEEAILVKNDESNFGRTEFRRLTSSAKFLKMDRPALGELFADFASSKGDLTFTKNARFIGVMTDSKHAVVIDAFLASGAIPLGDQYNAVEAKSTVQRLEDRLRKLPSEVR